MTDHAVAIDALSQSCRRLFENRKHAVAEKERHQTEIAALQLQINELNTDIDNLNASIAQLGGKLVTSTTSE